MKLALTSATTIKWLVMLVLGAGAVTNATVQDTLQEMLPSWGQDESLPIPEGEVVAPSTSVNQADDAFRAQLTQSLHSMKRLLDKHSGEIKVLALEIDEMEERVEAESDAGDLKLDERLTHVEELVQ